MKKIYKLSILTFMVLAFTFSLSAQRLIVIEGWDPAQGGSSEDYNDVLFHAIEGDTTGRKEDPNTIYVLKRNHKYPMGQTIKNYDYHLHIRGEEGDGLLPEVIPGKEPDGSYSQDFINAYNDLTLEYITFNGFCPDGQYNNRMVEAKGLKTTYTVRGCNFIGDRGAGIAVRADSMKVFIYDVTVSNTGHRKSVGGNGRFLDFRKEALYVDTVIIKNSTLNNASDRFVRNMNTVINYIEIDHVTAINCKGYHGTVQLGYVHEAYVTNSIFANTISLGHVQSRAVEQTQPEQHFSVITLDTVLPGQILEVRNNNIYTDQVVLDVWAKYDSVSAPFSITPTIETALGDDAGNAYIEEPLVFAVNCGPIVEYVDAYFANPSAEELPENWCVGGEGGYFPDQTDLSYGKDADSYTAGDKGFPLGNLNYYPDQKERWEQGLSPVSINGETALENSISIYPNPVIDGILNVELNQDGITEISIIDITGKVLYQKRSDLSLIQIELGDINSGVYILKIDGKNSSSAKRFIVQ